MITRPDPEHSGPVGGGTHLKPHEPTEEDHLVNKKLHSGESLSFYDAASQTVAFLHNFSYCIFVHGEQK